MRRCSCLVAAVFVLIALIAGGGAAAQSSNAPPPAKSQEGLPPQISELLRLLDDPTVRQWLTAQRAPTPSPTEGADPATSAISRLMSSRATAVREHVVALATKLPEMPGELRAGAGRLSAEIGGRGAPVFVPLALLVVLAVGFEWLLRKLLARAPRDDVPGDDRTVHDRLRAIGMRLGADAGAVGASVVGGGVAVLALEWPPLLREVALGYLLALVILRATGVVGRQLLAPAADRFRIIPVGNAAARFWQHRLTVFVGWLAFGWVTTSLLGALGVSLDGRRLIAYALGLGLVIIAVEATWRRPDEAAAGIADNEGAGRRGRSIGRTLLSVYFLVLWGLWVVHAMPAFWFGLIALVLPLAIGVMQRAIDRLLLPVSPQVETSTPSVADVGIERGARALLIIGAVAALAWAWGIDLVTLAKSDTLFTRMIHGFLSAVVIALIADVAWHMAKAAIDRKLAESADPAAPDSDEARRQARLRTLLPILRNVLLIVIVVIAAMMALSAMGVEIGPLIAGAGVIGVAVGFGAQTLVRDVISGMFYLLDDAFRVGEYIQSGNYRGTVESFSLRSVKLRHHRGPLYTVPFGVLGAVQNQSRDWVIDKLTIEITYDSDLALAKRLIKAIGKDLQNEPDFAPHIIETLKMQGVEQFGDYGVAIRLKMMTRPGEQFVIRRHAYALIKKAFDANGIKFASPTVHVAGHSDFSPAAAATVARGLETAAQRPVD